MTQSILVRQKTQSVRGFWRLGKVPVSKEEYEAEVLRRRKYLCEVVGVTVERAEKVRVATAHFWGIVELIKESGFTHDQQTRLLRDARVLSTDIARMKANLGLLKTSLSTSVAIAMVMRCRSLLYVQTSYVEEGIAFYRQYKIPFKKYPAGLTQPKDELEERREKLLRLGESPARGWSKLNFSAKKFQEYLDRHEARTTSTL